MELYKQFLLYTFEICFSVFIIIYGYGVWDNFDRTNFEIAKSNSNIRDVSVYLDDNILSLHNISGKDNTTKLLFRIDKKYNKDNIVKLNNEVYNLDNIIDEDNDYIYYLVDEISFDGYETKKMSVSVEVKSDDELSYAFMTRV